MSTLRPLLGFICCVAAIAALSRPPEKQRRRESEAPLLPRKEFLQVVGAGYKALLADYYWLLTTYVTGNAVTSEDYRGIYYYADLVTDLDPDFNHVYVFAGVVIPYNFGRETWVNTEESTRLLRKGVARFPQDVFLRILLAYNLSYFDRNYAEAARILEETARLPDAPPYVSALATRLYAQSGETEAGIAFAEELAATASDPETRQAFEQRVLELKLEQELQRVDEAAAAYRARVGHTPTTIAELLVSGDLTYPPVDPMGGEISFGPDGRARSSSVYRRLETYDPRKDAPLPRESKRSTP